MKPIPFKEASVARAQRALGLISLIAAVLSTVIVIAFGFIKSDRPDFAFIPSSAVVSSQAQQALEAEVGRLRAQVGALRDEMNKLAAIPEEGKLAAQVTIISGAAKSLDERLQKLETAILANPAKALEIPLLQRDLEGLRQAQQANLAAVKEGVDRLYDVNKWLLGAMAISIITLAISNFLRPRDSEKRE